MFPSLLIFCLLCFAAASTGAIFKPGAWYKGLAKPSWTPPNWVFPVVWTILFAMMAIAGWRVWKAAGVEAWPSLALFVLHLGVNAAWSYLFFGRRRLDWAMVDVLTLAAMVAVLTLSFLCVDEIAALLLVPYLAWVCLAATLNFRVLQMNGPRGEGRTAT
ncbi:MAG: TspO/MBR family protein [Pseudomonadota bacterium]